MHDIVAVHVLHGREDALHNLSTFFVIEAGSFCFALLDEVGERSSVHELHGEENLTFDLSEL